MMTKVIVATIVEAFYKIKNYKQFDLVKLVQGVL